MRISDWSSDVCSSDLSPPLRGGPWVAVYDPGMERGHRRVFYATEGSATLPGRFAIDFMKLDERGKLSSGDAAIPAIHHGFGADRSEERSVGTVCAMQMRSRWSPHPTNKQTN